MINKLLTQLGLTPDSISQSIVDLAAFVICALVAVVIWIIGRRLIKALLKGLDRVFEKRKVDVTVARFLRSLLKWVLYFMLIVLIVDFLGIPTSTMLTALGSAGLTLGLALQGSLSNFAGGVLILLFRPFKVGDYIIEQSMSTEAKVVKIEILYTTLLTYDNRTLIIPNGSLSASSIVNLSLEKKRRVEISVGVAYSTDLELARNTLMSMLKKCPSSLKDEPMEVLVTSLDESCISLKLRCWCLTDDYWNTLFSLTEETAECLKNAGVTIAFPQLDVHLPVANGQTDGENAPAVR